MADHALASPSRSVRLVRLLLTAAALAFVLVAAPGAARADDVQVRHASPTEQAGGTVMIAGGSVLATGGVVGLVIGTTLLTDHDGSCAASATSDAAGWGCGVRRLLGLITVVISGAGTLCGTALIVGGASMVSDTKLRTPQKPVAVREPTWTAPRPEAPSRGSAFVMPLSFSF